PQELEKPPAANAVIGVAYDPGRTSPHPRNNPLRHLIAIGNESTRRWRHAQAAGNGGMSVIHPKPCTSERSRSRREPEHACLPSTLNFPNVEFDGLEPPTSIVLSNHSGSARRLG